MTLGVELDCVDMQVMLEIDSKLLAFPFVGIFQSMSLLEGLFVGNFKVLLSYDGLGVRVV